MHSVDKIKVEPWYMYCKSGYISWGLSLQLNILVYNCYIVKQYA